MIQVIIIIALVVFIGVALIRRSKNKLSKIAEIEDKKQGVKADQEIVRRRIQVKNELDVLGDLINELDGED